MIFELESVAKTYLGGNIELVAKLVSECLLGVEVNREEKKKLSEVIQIREQEIVTQKEEIEEKTKRIEMLDQKIRQVKSQMAEAVKKEEDLQIQLRLKGKEVDNLKIEKEKKADKKQDGQVMELVHKLYVGQEKRIPSLETRMKVMEKPAAVILQILHSSLVIPTRLKNVSLDAWGEVEGGGVQAINEWGQSGWCAVVTSPECEIRGIKITVDRSVSFRAGRSKIRLRLEYQPKEQPLVVDPNSS